MAEVTFRIPSRTVQYGYVEFAQEMGDLEPGMLASVYVNYVYAFQKEEEATIKRLQASQEAAPGDPQAAADRLAGGRKPRTVDEANEMAKQVIENELGPTTEVEENDNIPWNREVARQQKPWENGTTAPKAVDLGDDW